MEQFPRLLAGIRERREVEVKFYSQGIERTLIFRSAGDRVLVQRRSRTDWAPDPEFEDIPHKELEAMLVERAHAFAMGLESIGSPTVGKLPFAGWLKGDV